MISSPAKIPYTLIKISPLWLVHFSEGRFCFFPRQLSASPLLSILRFDSRSITSPSINLHRNFLLLTMADSDFRSLTDFSEFDFTLTIYVSLYIFFQTVLNVCRELGLQMTSIILRKRWMKKWILLIESILK